MSTIIIPSIPNYRPVRVDLPKKGEYIHSRGTAYQAEVDHPYHEIILEPRLDEPGKVLYKVPVYGLPEGYRPLEYGTPREGTYSIDSQGKLLKWNKGDYCSQEWLLLEQVTNTVKVRAPRGFKPFAIRPPKEGDLYYDRGEVVRCSNPRQIPRLVVVPYRDLPQHIELGMKGFFGNELVERELLGFNYYSGVYQGEAGVDEKFQVGLDAGEVELVVEVPDGYRPVRWAKPGSKDEWVSSNGSILKGNSSFECLIVEANWEVPTEPLGQQAKFCDDPADGWETGTLEGIGKNKEGETLFIDEEDTAWKRCEVQPCQR